MNSFQSIKTIFAKELKYVLRDKKSLFTFLFFSVFFLPLLFSGVIYLQKFIEEKAEDQKIVLGVSEKDKENSIVQKLFTTTVAEIKPVNDYIKEIKDKQIDAYLELDETSKPIKVKLVFDEGTNKSSMFALKVQSIVESYAIEARAEVLKKNNLTEIDINPVFFERKTIQELENKSSSTFLSSFLPYILLLALIQGSIQLAVESTAGEKEKNTMMTTLSLNVPRSHIILGKSLSIFAFSLFAAALNVASLILTFTYFSKSLGDADSAGLGDISLGLNTSLQILLILIPLALMTSILLIIIGISARNQKEGNLYLTPIMLIVIFIGLSAPAFDTDSMKGIFAIPLVGHVASLRQILLGTFDIQNVLLVTISTILASVLLIFLGIKMFNSEKIMFRK